VRNCQAFNSQMGNFVSYVQLLPACQPGQTCADVANRRGELLARARTLLHLYNDRFLPSIPSNGFDEETYKALLLLPSRNPPPSP
jgi:hypothetical protein